MYIPIGLQTVYSSLYQENDIYNNLMTSAIQLMTTVCIKLYYEPSLSPSPQI